MAQNYSLLIESADNIVWDSRYLRRHPKIYVTISLDNDPVSRTPVFKRSLQPKWNFKSHLFCPLTSMITLRLYHHTSFPRREDPVIGQCKISIEELLHQCGSGQAIQLEIKADSKVSGRLSVLLKKSEVAARKGQGWMESLLTQTPAKPNLDRIDAAVEAGGSRSDLATALDACLDRISVVVKMGDKLAQVHPYVSAAWSILSSVYQAVKQQHEMDDKVVKLVKDIVELYSFKDDIHFVVEKIQILGDTLIKIAKHTLICANFLQEYSQPKFSEQAIRTAFVNDNQKRIEDLSDQLVRLKESFTHALRIQSLLLKTEVHGTVAKLDELEKLRHMSYDASLRTGCLPGTREDILADIFNWLTTPSSSSNILWLSGVAGSGKSSIATTLAQQLRDQDCLGAFLFLTRNNLATSNPTVILHTIAYQLAQANTTIWDALCTVIAKTPDILDTPINDQLETLLRGPLLSVKPYMDKPLVIILDALDECSDPNWRKSLISLIANGFTKLPVGLRFLITSRLDAEIAGPFKAQPHITVRTLSISSARNRVDIALYIHSRLQNIQREHHSIPKEWPGESAVTQVAQQSGGLFIWASTACNFIEGFSPQQKLKKLLAGDFEDRNSLDDIYTIALQSCWNNGDNDFAKEALAILGCIVLARAPLSDQAIDSLISLEPGTTSGILECLGCVIHHAGDGTAIVLHASFSGYLMDATRSGNYPWTIECRIHHRSLALGCFHVLGSQLRFNICQLEDSHLLNAEVPDLATRLETYLSSELCYASQYWANHLDQAELTKDILDKLQELLGRHFLYWLEVISLCGQVSRVNEMLTIAQNCATKSGSNDLNFALHDAQRFVDGFGPVISQSTPHIYISALPLAPKESLVQRNFAMGFPGVLKYRSPDSSWLNLQKTLTSHSDTVSSVAISPDGRQIASGSHDNTVRIWDSETGATVGALLTGHSDRVLSVAFSPNGRQIVSGSCDNTVRIWDLETGTVVGAPLTGHSDTVWSVAFSPDGRWIVSGCSDNTVCIWDSETGATVGAPLIGHSGAVYSVAFSPDGRWIVSGSGDNTVCIWDSETGAAVGVPLTGHSDRILSVAFSPNGRQIVSGSCDNTIRIWDSETGAAAGVPLTGHSNIVSSVAISPDGRQIVSGSYDNTVRIWDSETGAAVGAPLTGHSDRVLSVAFSPNGRQIVSGSYDNTVCIWDSEIEATVAPLTGHSDRVLSVAFSPNGRQVVSGSEDNTVRIWDSETGAAVSAPLVGHSNTVSSVAISPDGRQIVSGSHDNTVRIWDSETGATVGAPLTGHSDRVLSVAFSPNGRQIVSGSCDNTVRIWDSETGATVGALLTGHSDRVLSVAFSPNGRQIVSGSCDNTVRIWDLETGTVVGAPLTGHSDTVWSVAFSPDGRWIVSGSGDNTVRIWDSATGAAVGAPLAGHSNTVSSVAISPDGRRIASASHDSTVRIWDSNTGAAIGVPLTGHGDRVLSVAFSSNGRQIVSSSEDNMVCIWDLTYILSSLHHEDNESPQMITISTMFTDGWITDLFSHQLIWVPAWLRAHFCGPPALLVITPNGVTTLDLTKFVHGKDWVKCMNIAGLVPNLSSYDDTVRMWHYEPGATVSAPLTGHSDTVSLVAILPDGMQIVSGSYDSTVHGDREWESGGQAGHAHEGGSGVDVHNALPIIDFTSPEVSVASLDQHTLSADSNSQISTAVLYSPGHSMNIQSNIQPNDIQSVETQLPDGGSISSVHSPNNAAAWIEMHYDDILPESIRAQGLGGPIAAMLSPETEALIIFGSILNDWVLAAAKLLSDVSNFTVMIRPLTEDPTPKWSVIQDTGFFNQRDAWEDMHDISIAQSPIMIPEESSEGEDDAETAESMDSSTDSDPDNLDLGTGVFRLRGGASTSDSRYNPSRSPVHNLDIRLAIQPSTDLEHQVNILSKLRFTTQPKYLDEQLEGYRPQIISWTQLSVVPKTKAILPDRSYSSVGFLVHGQYISKCDPLPSDNFMRPNQTTKVVNTDISLNTITAKLTAGPHPTGEVSFARNNGHNTAVENQNDRITPKWIVDCQHGHEFEEDGKYYEELNFSYMSTCKSKEEQHPLQVEFSMGINVDDLENPSNTAIPPTAFIIRNQTMLWVSNRSLKSQGTGIIVLTSAYISEIQAVDQLSIVEKHTIQLGNSTIKAPLTETAPTKNPENRLSLSIGMRPNQVKPGLLQRITDLVTKPRSNPMKIAQDDEIQSLPLYEFASRGWDATKHEWRMPIYPSLNHCLQQAVENSKLHTWQLTVVGSEAHNIGKSKGKQRDPGPAIIQVTNQDKVTNTLEGSEGTPPTAQIPDQVTLPGSLETTSKI